MKRGLNSWEWGYCPHCNRMEPIDKEGNITAHLGHAGYINDRGMCAGSLEAPSEPPGPECSDFGLPHKFTPKQLVMPPNRRRPRDPDLPVMDVFGHPLHEIAERFKKEAAEAERKRERKYGKERG